MKALKRIAIGLGIIMAVCGGCVMVVNLLPSSKTEPTVMYRVNPVFSPTTAPSNTPTITNTPTETATSTIIVPPLTQTAQAIATQRTETAQAKTGTATFLAGYKLLGWQELVNYPNNHHWENIKIYGTVFHIVGDDMFQMYVGGYNAVVVETATPLSGLYPGASIWVYGTVEGLTCSEGLPVCLTNSYGADLYQPLLTYAFWFPA
jgi:hypothetical protein